MFNEWTCIYLPVFLLICIVFWAIVEEYERQQRQKTKDRLTNLRAQKLAQDIETNQTVSEAKVAVANNKVVKSDIEIDIATAKLKLLQQKAGITDKPFDPENYSPRTEQ